MFKLFRDYLKDEEGQTSTEYVLLLVVVALLVMKFKNKAVTKIDVLTETIFNGATTAAQQLEQEINRQ